MKTIPISKPYNIKKSAKEIQKIINNDWISSAGQNVIKFEKLFAHVFLYFLEFE